MNESEIRKTASELGFPCVIPVVKIIRNTGNLRPTDVYAALTEEGSFSFLLESAELGEKVARYSYLGREPEKTISVKRGKLKINGEEIETKNPLLDLSKLVSRYNVAQGKLPKFFGGLLGYVSYDMVRYFEDIGSFAPDELAQDDAYFLFVRDLVVFDHWREEILLISNLVLEAPDNINSELERSTSCIDELRELIKNAKKQDLPSMKSKHPLNIKSNFNKEEFQEAVKSAKEHIYAGDIFQVVLSQRFSVKGVFDAFNVYQVLKEINPSPYMYLLNFDEIKIIGSSPEILVKTDKKTVTVRPIAGTRPRGSDVVEDEALSREMVNDEKERAEHIMLVDLGRNDVGKVSEFGTVKVTEFFGIEKYSHVQHIISNVKGRIRDNLSSFDALEAAFPAGTVTGAPKVRAMQIIEELEPSQRGIYAGSVGVFCFDGDMDFAITIRTIILENGAAFVQAGAGIVADSVPENEYQETLNKGRAMLKALELAGESR